MECKFYVGQKVTRRFIQEDSHWERGPGGPAMEGPKHGEICTITAVFLHPLGNVAINIIGYVDSYEARCFEPLVEKEIDISIFTKMLTPERETV